MSRPPRAQPPGVVRRREDACPGVVRLTAAADGSLARVRLVGGFVSALGLSALGDAAATLGDGRIELTSRGNAQLRGLAADAGAELGRRLHDAGLWPSASHERVRNIVASPLAGLDRDDDLGHLVAGLDRALCAVPRLAELSGRFLFAVDDGRGDLLGLGADVLLSGGTVNGLRTADPVTAALAFAGAFLDERATQRSEAWRVADLVDGAARLRARVAASLGLVADPTAADPTAADPTASGPVQTPGPPVAGLLEQVDGGHALVVAVPLGRLDLHQLRWLARSVGDRPARVTPWRSIVLPDVGPAAVEQARTLGFGVTADSPWLSVSACAGRPGCAKALADVQRDARDALARWPGRVVHWSGCERRCGRPGRTEIDVVATGSTYRIEGI
jgi:precorrin-3B synthase